MRINEAYAHEPILPCQTEDSCSQNACGRVGTQCVDIAAPMMLTPTAVLGEVSVACQGYPVITCETAPDGASCVVTMTQQVCVSVPVCYGVELTAGEPTIACADNNCSGCGCC